MAKVMQSLASTLATSLLMGWRARPADVIGVLKRGQLPGGRKTTGPVTAGVKTALGFVASMMPLVTRSDGSRTWTWPRAIWQNVAPKVLLSHSCASFVAKSPSAAGVLVTTRVKRIWMVCGVLPGLLKFG